MRNTFLLFLFSVGLFSTQVYASNTTADNATVDCQIAKPESYINYDFVDSKDHEFLQVVHEKICKKVEDEEWDLDRGNWTMRGLVERCGVCRDDHIYQGFEKYWKKKKVWTESLGLAVKKFCLDTYNPAKRCASVIATELVPRTKWLEKEWFCQVTHEMAYPTGFLMILSEPELPCIKKYQERTDSICQELRNGDITYDEAVYRWQLADLEFQKRLGPETLKKMGRGLKKPIETLIDIFK